MELTELMVGNIVGRELDKYPHNIFIVEEIGQTCKLYEFPHTDPRAQAHYFDVNDIEPVPFTEDWLPRLMYKLDATSDHVFHELNVKRLDLLYKHEEFGYEEDDWRDVQVVVIKDPENGELRGIKIKGVANYFISMDSIQWLHDFQNAFRCLAGEPINVKHK